MGVEVQGSANVPKELLFHNSCWFALEFAPKPTSFGQTTPYLIELYLYAIQQHQLAS
jgi:hypothetical protein